MPASFLWYDLETWGTDPRQSRIAQFAAQRTDAELNPLDEPILTWVAPALDFLPAPEAALVTGLDPFEVERRGVCEAEAFAGIAATMSLAGTCTVGWNSLRFDDEFVRFGLYRNFHDPYAREWANGNSRWDLLDFARFCHALRPAGIEWPKREDGFTSFRLEHLAAANSIVHSHAHDALSDVEATIGMARLFRTRQPRLWDYHLGFRDKRRVAELLDVDRPQPLLHVSSKFPASRACAGIVWPVCRHPRAGNQIIVLELHDDPAELFELDAEEVALRVFSAADQLPPGKSRIALKAIHLNRCPALASLAHVREAECERMGLDLARCLRHAERLRDAPPLGEHLGAVYAEDRFGAGARDVDGALYDALPERRDERLRTQLRDAAPAELAAFAGRFHDPRGDELLWRYRARNWPQTLDMDERRLWNAEVRGRLTSEPAGAASALDAQRDRLAALRAEHPDRLPLLDQILRWTERVDANCASAD